MTAEMGTIVNAIGTHACEVVNAINPELSSIRAAVESMDSDTQGELQKINSKLADIYGVLEDIRDLLQEQQNGYGERERGKKPKTRSV